jgi:hypothetical protein
MMLSPVQKQSTLHAGAAWINSVNHRISELHRFTGAKRSPDRFADASIFVSNYPLNHMLPEFCQRLSSFVL